MSMVMSIMVHFVSDGFKRHPFQKGEPVLQKVDWSKVLGSRRWIMYLISMVNSQHGGVGHLPRETIFPGDR